MEEKTINLLYIKVSFGKEEVKTLYELGDSFEIKSNVVIVKKEIRDNQDGTVDIVYVAKPLSVEIVNE